MTSHIRHLATSRRVRRWASLIGFPGLALAAVAFAVAVRLSAAQEDAAKQKVEPPLPVEVATVSYLDSYEVRRAYTGAVRAARVTELNFERPGRVLAVLVDQGDEVEVGDELARLDQRHLLAAQRQVTAQKTAAEAILKELEQGPREELIVAQEADVARLSAEVALAELNLKRRQELQDRSAITQEEFDSVRYSLEAREAALAAARARLAELINGTRPEKIEAQQAVVQQLEAQLAEIGHNLEDTVLTAPFAGVVTARYVDEGGLVGVSAPVFRLLESDQLEAWVGVPVAAASLLGKGDVATLVTRDRELKGEIAAVLPEVEAATRTRRVVVRITDRDIEARRVVAGQTVRLTVHEREAGRGFWLPTGALVQGQRGLWNVYVVAEPEDSRAGGAAVAQRRDVETLHTSGEWVYVRGTVSEGDRVVATGAHRLTAGQRVEVIGVTAASPEES